MIVDQFVTYQGKPAQIKAVRVVGRTGFNFVLDLVEPVTRAPVASDVPEGEVRKLKALPERLAPEKAKAVAHQCRSFAGPDARQLLTPGEHAFVMQFWDTLPGDTSYMNALRRIGEGQAA